MLNKHILKKCEFYKNNYLTPDINRDFPMTSESEESEPEASDESGVESEY